jgi:hypothetical protein
LLVYYRIYAEDGAIPSKTSAASGDPFLGRIKARSVPPPNRDTAKAVKRTIAKVENIRDRTSPSLFLTPYSQSPIGDDDKLTILNGTGPGSTSQEPLALVAKMSDSERSDLESGVRAGLASAAAELDTRSPDIRYRTSIQHPRSFLFVLTSRLLGEVYYLLYSDDYEMPSKVAIDPEEPSLGRIRADSVAPPHSPLTIKRCISRVEKSPELADATLFADITCNTPLKDGHFSILRTDCPGLSPKNPMAIVQPPLAPIPDGRYVIKNRAANVVWNVAWNESITTICFGSATIEGAKLCPNTQVNRHSPIIQVFRE